MAFRVLIAGGRHFTDYATLRSLPDKLLANRMPGVEVLTAGAGGPMLAASYATEKGLACTALVPEFGRFPDARAVACRDADRVALAVAAVLVLEDREPGVRRLLEAARAKGIPIHVVGDDAQAARVKPVRRAKAGCPGPHSRSLGTESRPRPAPAASGRPGTQRRGAFKGRPISAAAARSRRTGPDAADALPRPDSEPSAAPPRPSCTPQGIPLNLSTRGDHFFILVGGLVARRDVLAEG